MSGHSKWSTIKRKKGAIDAKRGKIFTKIIKEITLAARLGGGDIDGNARLRQAVMAAKEENMPKDNIERAIKKGIGGGEGAAAYEEVTYEGYAPNGVAVFVECTTDNLQRTVSAIRSYFNKYNGSLGTNGSLSFIFERKGIFTVPVGSIDPEEFEMEAIDGGAEDIVLEEGYFTITTAMEDFGRMQKKLEELGVEAESAGLQRIPNTTVKLDVDSGRKVMKLIDVFEDDDDVSQVFHNLEITDELADALDE